MKQEINVYDFARAFKDMDRDYYSQDGYQALFDYFDEFEGFDLDVVAICCDVSEYEPHEILNEYSYLLSKEDDQEEKDYFDCLIEELINNTMVIKLDNDNFLVWAF